MQLPWGDNWRKRYHSLALHNPTDVNHLPYMPFPLNWPVYLPKDMLADWFEAYAWTQEINFWTRTELTSGSYDEAAGHWNVVVRHGGGERIMRPKHLVFANGLVGFPRIPDLPGLKDFKGEVMHTSAFTNGAHWRGKKALVLGTGTSTDGASIGHLQEPRKWSVAAGAASLQSAIGMLATQTNVGLAAAAQGLGVDHEAAGDGEGAHGAEVAADDVSGADGQGLRKDGIVIGAKLVGLI